jgi:hypothetical protein
MIEIFLRAKEDKKIEKTRLILVEFLVKILVKKVAIELGSLNISNQRLIKFNTNNRIICSLGLIKNKPHKIQIFTLMSLAIILNEEITKTQFKELITIFNHHHLNIANRPDKKSPHLI